MPKPRPCLERFWEKVLKIEGAAACWPWMGRSLHFYDGISYWHAHHFSYAIHYGHVPKEHNVLRSCGDLTCVRPTHLEAVPRGNRGTRHPRAKLTEGTVLMVMRALRIGVPREVVAEQYGVSLPTISGVATGKTWKHVPREPLARLPKQQKKKRPRKKKLTPEQVREIRRRREEGALVVSLAEEFGVGPSHVSAICYRRAYKEVE